MNDRFKFRLWNKARQCFMTEKEIFICGNGELVLIDKALNRTWVKDNPNYKVSFSTGLKDKNGKLIYEGDILKSNRGNVRVDYDNIEACFGVLNFLTVTPFAVLSNQEWEVIGNIYENKELLNEI